MSHLESLVTAIAHCDLHFGIYSAFGATLMLRALFCKPEHYPGEAREHFMHGIVYFSLGLLP
jgi:hypothetical protein